MGGTFITTPEGQKEAITILFAKMYCQLPDGHCSTCLRSCEKNIMPRIYPVIKIALIQTEEKT